MGFLFFALIALYLAFLNPQDIDLHLTRSHSARLPVLVLLLGSVVLGVMITAVFNGLHEIRGLPIKLRETFLQSRREKKRQQCEKQYEEAENALIGGHLKQARSLFQKIVSANPNHVPSLICLGDFMRQDGKYDQAIETHGLAARLAPRNIKILYSLAEDYAAARYPNKEIQVLQEIQKLDADSPLPLHKLRDVWMKTQDWDQATGIQKELLRLVPGSKKEKRRLCEIIHIHAMRYYKDGDILTAIARLKSAIKVNKHSLPAYIAIGDIYLKDDRRKEALKMWKAGYANTKSTVCLQRIRLVSENDFIKLCESAVHSANNSESSVPAMLGSLLLEKGEIEKAVQILDYADTSSMLHHILLIIARQAKNSNGQLPDASRAIVSKVKQALSQYACKECDAFLKEWVSHCPTCRAWDSIVLAPQIGPVF